MAAQVDDRPRRGGSRGGAGTVMATRPAAEEGEADTLVGLVADPRNPCTRIAIYVHPSRRAQLDHTKSGAQHAIHGLLFISSGNKASNAWIEGRDNENKRIFRFFVLISESISEPKWHRQPALLLPA